MPISIIKCIKAIGDRCMASNILSKKEQQVFGLIVSGMPRKEIAKILGISIRTVAIHVRAIRRRSIKDGNIRIRQ